MPKTIPLQTGWAYGPVASRRFGRSLGVNLLPIGRKLCSFDCVYCQYDATPAGALEGFPAADEVLDAVALALPRGPCDAVTIAGNGEPTLHPAFRELARGLAALRDVHAPAASLVLLTNGTRLDEPEVRAGLAAIDRTWVKLDAGDEATLRAIDRPRGFTLHDLERGLRALERPFGLQALFVEGARDNAGERAIAAWLDLVARLAPAEVHVTTIDRGTALDGLRPVPASRLEAIAAAVRAGGIPAASFACPDEGRFA